MVRVISIIAVALIIVGCGQPKMIDGVEYKTVGLAEMYGPNKIVGSDYRENIQYEVCWGNVILGAVLCETIIAPIYFYGFSMYNPVGKVTKEVQ